MTYSRRVGFKLLPFILLCGGWGGFTWAQAPTAPPPTPPAGQPAQPPAKPPEKKEELKPFDEVAKDAEKLEGLFTFYRKKEKLYLELKPDQENKLFYCTVTMESGTGDVFLSGMPLQDFLFELRHVHDHMEMVLKNVFVRTQPKDPLRRAVERAFSDSPLVSAKVESLPHPERKSALVDVANPFLTDIAGIGPQLSDAMRTNYTLDPAKTKYASVKTFPLNVEIESLLAFNGAKPGSFSALPDPRYFNLRIHYSLSQLPETNYRPRLADPRVGYFLTAYKDFSNDSAKTPFVRYINRWNLEPGADGQAKKPIVFWLENTIPNEYRDAVREGVLMWSKAFERAGVKGAIEARVQPDDATWDADDVRYSTIRWVASMGAGFAMGPSWVNPLTGEILDADVIVQADMLRYVKQEYRNVVRLRGDTFDNLEPELPFLQLVKDRSRLCTIGRGMAREGAFGALSLILQERVPSGEQVPKEYIDAYLRRLICHEVGHTLGLRHNFRASTFLPLNCLHDVAMTKERGLVGSVMDYDPVNLAPKGAKQGEYFTSTVGPYDLWAIEYGYNPIGAKTTDEELPELKRIASRAPSAELAYGTDEDAVGLDPTIERWDLSSDPLAWRKQRMELARQMLRIVARKIPERGESYTDLREAFDSLFYEAYAPALSLTIYIGGQRMNRHHRGDPGGRPPFELLSLAAQRQALKLMMDSVFSAEAFQFSPTLLNELAPDRWSHWGNPPADALDYPLHDRALSLQRSLLFRLIDPVVLRRLLNNEFKVRAPKDALTIAELFSALRASIWSELQATRSGRSRTDSRGKPVTISSLRRSLQRQHLNALIGILLRPTQGTPEDARTLAWHELSELQIGIVGVLRGQRSKLGTPTLAHLEESRQRIYKALEVQLEAAR